MKLEKREITLNEYDSLQDIFFMQKNLLFEYVFALEKTTKKETRSELLHLMMQTGEDLCFVRDLLSGSSIENTNEEDE